MPFTFDYPVVPKKYFKKPENTNKEFLKIFFQFGFSQMPTGDSSALFSLWSVSSGWLVPFRALPCCAAAATTELDPTWLWWLPTVASFGVTATTTFKKTKTNTQPKNWLLETCNPLQDLEFQKKERTWQPFIVSAPNEPHIFYPHIVYYVLFTVSCFKSHFGGWKTGWTHTRNTWIYRKMDAFLKIKEVLNPIHNTKPENTWAALPAKTSQIFRFKTMAEFNLPDQCFLKIILYFSAHFLNSAFKVTARGIPIQHRLSALHTIYFYTS